jgi:O-methyltransferase
MKRIAIFGAGGFGKRYATKILTGQDRAELLCFFDNSFAKQGQNILDIEVLPPEKIKELPPEVVVVVVTPGFEDDIIAQIHEIDPERKIEIPDFAKAGMCNIENRNVWLNSFAKLVYERKILGNVAEVGVFRGDFAKNINAVFPDRTLYLFDTFEGFPALDVEKEPLASNSKPGYYDATSEELVLSKLPHRNNVVVGKGYFPETASGVPEDERFCFVNLDLDLYQPTLAGLNFFHDKMSAGGVILIHDYFGIDFPNVKTAVTDFEKEIGAPLKLFPIGDDLSIGIIK